MAKKCKKSKMQKSKNNMNSFHKRIKNVFVAEGLYSTYTFFTLGKNFSFIHHLTMNTFLR
ncbi:hypothetical protein [Lentibacillus salicampi]|uniref:Uncharacterized protein n=1 Tax=Lentibacillus salicampi TaxID=175306 RepID=A0A4Y9A6C5_9BACI|nr:hypothetical protein [Lentibacillus salicampi]TFJ90680.1 hypothetical protein E4U82_19020 [Lentibacillus salicampi]